MTTALNPRTGRAFEQTARGFDCYTFKKPLPFERNGRKLVLLHGDDIAGIAASLEDALAWVNGGKVLLAPPPTLETLRGRAIAQQWATTIEQLKCVNGVIFEKQPIIAQG